MSELNTTSNDAMIGDHIDAHAHVWTDDLQRYPLSNEFSKSDMNPPRFTAEDLLAICEPLDVKRVVLIQMVFYGNDNSYMLDCIEQFPDRFAGVALVDENGADPAAEMRRLKPLGVRGVRITPPAEGASRWLESPGMQAMWATAAEEELSMCPLIDPSDLSVIDQMCARHPNTSVVIDHCARIGGDGSIRDTDVATLCRLAAHPKTNVKLSAFYFLGAKQPPYTDLSELCRVLLDAYGSRRLMWASDSPFQVQTPHTYQASIELIRDRLEFLTAEQRENILSRTAARLFFDEQS